VTRLSLGAGVAALALLAAPVVCAQSRAPGLVPNPSTVEAGLWSTSDRAERDARASAELNADANLNRYVREVMCSVAPEYCNEVRVYVMDRQVFNATAAPNGYVEVWSGLLLRAQSDAELAFVLGHEISHYAENHTIERYSTLKTYQTVAMVLTVGAGVAGAYYGVDLSSVGDLAYLSAISAFFGYNRGQEAEADTFGVRRAATAGYDPAAAPAIWEALQAETAASTFPSVRRSEAANSLFRTHPLTAERVAYLKREAAALTGPTAADRARHRAAIRPFLSPWLEEELVRRDYGGLLLILDRLATLDEDQGVINFYRGEAFRQRRGDGDQERAALSYRSAVTFADAPVQAWRELGDMERKLGNHTAARAAWTEYLARAPNADDRWIVEDSLESLEPA
jgi:Zn-dependent protease with chaperone function